MDDLVAFLAARLDEDEAAAKDERVYFGPHPETIGEHEGWLVIQEERLLREVAAKQAILADYAATLNPGSLRPGDDYAAGYAEGNAAASRFAAIQIAAVYREHPDFRAEWKP